MTLDGCRIDKYWVMQVEMCVRQEGKGMTAGYLKLPLVNS